MHFLKSFAILSVLTIMAASNQDGFAQSTEGSAKNINSAIPVITTALVSQDKHRPRIGLALGGGGARGAAHVGVLKVFVEEGIPIDMIAGTSVGSVVGGLFSAGVPLNDLSHRFESGSLMKEFTPLPLSLQLLLGPMILLPRLFGYHPYDGLYKGVMFRNYINSLVDDTNRDIELFPIPFVAVCTNVVDGQRQHISRGNLGIALQASTAVPGLRKPVQVGDNLFCDGGLVCNLPVPDVREMGADFVIAVDIDERLDPVPLDKFRAPGSVSRQALRIQLAREDYRLGKQADFVIHPDTNGISLISRKAKDGRRGIAAGMKAAREAMPELKRKLAALGVELAITPQTPIIK